MKTKSTSLMAAILLAISLVGCGVNPDSHSDSLQATSSKFISEYTFQEDTSDCRNVENELGYNTEVGECTDFQTLSPKEIQEIDYQVTNLIGSNVTDTDLSGTSVDATFLIENSLMYSENTVVGDGTQVKDINMQSVLNKYCSKLNKGKGLKKGIKKKCGL